MALGCVKLIRKASVGEIIKTLEETDLISGMGITKTVVPEDSNAPIRIETWNAVVRGSR